MTNDWTAGKDGGQYVVFHPDSNYRGRTGGDLCGQYTNWLIHPCPDKFNNEDIVFLRGTDFPSVSPNGSRLQHSKSVTSECGIHADPMIRVGDNKLEISDEQTIFFPIAMSLVESIDNNQIPDNETNRRSHLRHQLERIRPTTFQVTINKEPLHLPMGRIEEHRIESPEFTLSVPDTPYMSSLKDLLSVPLKTPGKHQCIVGGYFFMIKFRPGSYVVNFYGKLSTNSDLEPDPLVGLYNIDVLSNGESRIDKPRKFTSRLIAMLQEKYSNGEIEEQEIRKLYDFLGWQPPPAKSPNNNLDENYGYRRNRKY